jgi:hypothetical protein
MPLTLIRRAFTFKNLDVGFNSHFPRVNLHFLAHASSMFVPSFCLISYSKCPYSLVFISPPFFFPLNSHENINIELLDESKCIEVFQKLKHKCFIQLFPLNHMKTKGKSLSQLENQIANLTCFKLTQNKNGSMLEFKTIFATGTHMVANLIELNFKCKFEFCAPSNNNVNF